VAVLTKFGCISALAATENWSLNRFAFAICNRTAIFTHIRYIAILENLVFAGNWQQGGYVGSDKEPTHAGTNEKWGALTSNNKPPRFVCVHNGKRETAFELLQCFSNSIYKVQS
jgi:hypothetical protein